ncbi:unnamed protein product [Ascophyllum nodosum]
MMKLGSIAAVALSLVARRASGAYTPEEVDLPSPEELFPDVKCPLRCEDLFGKLEDGPSGKTQSVRLQVRGEPKSGTGMIAEWSWGALAHKCLYLQRLYGLQSCRVVWKNDRDNANFRVETHSIIFEPELAAKDKSKPCTCTGVKKVDITLSAGRKHMLPVDPTCRWFHARGITKKGFRACEPPDGGPVENHPQLWACVQESMCDLTDDSLQIAVLRDPRAVTVSSYFQLARQKSPMLDKEKVESVDFFFINHLDSIAQWISLRYVLFTQIMPERSEVFWYEDAVADPIEWHGRYYNFVGLRPPPRVIHHASAIATKGGSILGFPAKGLDYHPDGEEQAPTRTFRDELGAESLAMMDDVLRKWLPPIILRRLRLID